MSDENKSINFALDAETEQLLKDAAALSGMSLEQFCLAASRAKADLTVLLYGEKSTESEEGSKRDKDRWLPILELRESANDSGDPDRERKIVWEVNGEGMVRHGVKNSKEESLKALERLNALREKLFQGRVSSTNSADLIREAREERHRDMRGHGNFASDGGILVWGKPPFTEEAAKKLLATRDQIFQGRVSSTDSVDLIREARERRGKRQEELGSG